MSAITEIGLPAAPAGKARGYWTTVGRRIMRDKVSMACAAVLVADLRLPRCWRRGSDLPIPTRVR